MTDRAQSALLPNGLKDVLAPDAAFEAQVTDKILETFRLYGYVRVAPPLMEFEQSLLSGSGAGDDIAARTFRVMDPVSQKMMAFRPDMTIQVARIAATRLTAEPRPLRLSYAGPVLRIKGSQLRPSRQFTQAGVELLGADVVAADVEVIGLAANALSAAGVRHLSFDLNLPPLVGELCRSHGLDKAIKPALRAVLEQKDKVGICQVLESPDNKYDALANILVAAVDACGPAGVAIARLEALDLPEAALAGVQRLKDVVAGVQDSCPGLQLTVDAVENRGFEYQSGVSFSVFSHDARSELGRGGRYIAAGKEPATGFTLYLDAVMRALPVPQKPVRIFAPANVSATKVESLRQQGASVVCGFEPLPEDRAVGEAARLGCTHVVQNGKIEGVDKNAAPLTLKPEQTI